MLRDIVIERDLAQALVQFGWLHESERQNHEAILAAIGACLFRGLSAGVTPSGKPLIEIDLEAEKDAWVWAKPGSAVTPENAAKALSTVAKCSALVGFGPREFSKRLKAMAGIG